MKYTFKQYCDISNGVEIQDENDKYMAYVFANMKQNTYDKNLYCIENKWIFQVSGKTLYYSYVFIVQKLMQDGMKPFQIPEYINERLKTQGFKYKKLECKFLPEF